MATSRTRKKARRMGKLRLILILGVIATVVISLGWVYRNNSEPKETSELPVVSLESQLDSPISRSLHIEAVIPPLSDEQRWYRWIVEQVLEDPERWVQKPKLALQGNDREIFLALVLTESSFQQFDENGRTLDSGIDCDGLLQLSNNPAICDPEFRWNPFENVYCGAKYFVSLLKKWDGDYAMAIAEYKGAVDQMADGRMIPNPEHPDVQSVFANIRLR